MIGSGVFRVSLSRSDLKTTAFGVSVQPDLATDGEIWFKQMGNTTAVMSELALLQNEVPSVVQGLLANGFSISAVHNHLIEISPMIMFVHFSGMGDAMKMATGIRAALAGTKTPVSTSATKKAPQIDVKGVGQVFGQAGEIEDQVLSFDIPRSEQISVSGMKMPSEMGVESYLYFQAAGGGKAASQAEFALLASEVEAVTQTVTQHGMTITALHNHMTMVSPMLFWMHVWGAGDAVTIAKAWRAALIHTKSNL